MIKLVPHKEYAEKLNKKRIVAGIVFLVNDSNKILLVKPSYKVGWDIPGGSANADEAPKECAARELKEELGIDRPIGRLLVVDHVPKHGVLDEGIVFVFDGGALDAAEAESFEASLKCDKKEIVDAKFYDLLEMKDQLVPRLVRRLNSAIRAFQQQGAVLMCRDGNEMM